MEEKKEKKEPEEIPVDKDFLIKVLKIVDNLTKEVNLIKQGGLKPETPTKEIPKVKSVSPERDYIFQCAETQSIDKVPPSPQDIVRYGKRSAEFRKKVEILMKEHKVIQFTAFFLKKL